MLPLLLSLYFSTASISLPLTCNPIPFHVHVCVCVCVCVYTRACVSRSKSTPLHAYHAEVEVCLVLYPDVANPQDSPEKGVPWHAPRRLCVASFVSLCLSVRLSHPPSSLFHPFPPLAPTLSLPRSSPHQTPLSLVLCRSLSPSACATVLLDRISRHRPRRATARVHCCACCRSAARSGKWLRHKICLVACLLVAPALPCRTRAADAAPYL